MRPEHLPIGDPCTCGKSAASHRRRVEHPHNGGKDQLCADCRLPLAAHRIRNRPGHHGRRGSGPRTPYQDDTPFFDTESVNDAKGKARIIYMSCYSPISNTFFRRISPEGITSYNALSWMVAALSGNVPIAWFFAGYDQTLILRDLPPMLHWALLHPEVRRKPRPSGKGTYLAPIEWRGFKLNMLSTEMTIEKDGKKITLYDINRFYQCSFLRALELWNIGTEADRACIRIGKEARSTFDAQDIVKISIYCDLEVRLGAELWRRLKLAHKEAGLRPRKWLGPGQTAKAMLSKILADVYGRDRCFDEGSKGERRWQRSVRKAKAALPKESREPFATAFFGGRFENARIGTIHSRLYSADIASAYPYAISRLPCLVCGTWQHIINPSRRVLADATLGCVRYTLYPPHMNGLFNYHWAPFPWRDEDGSIAFGFNQRGWIWLPELFAGYRMGFQPHVSEAWLYYTDCKHRPYARHIPEYYEFRIRMGKDGPGIVVKLALNSGYGVKAQVIGLSPRNVYQSFIEAGNITSLTRAMLLDAMTSVGPEHVLMTNTDSITCDVRPVLDETKIEPYGKPALGSWDIQESPDGMCLIKQGIYYDLGDIQKRLKGRGIGRSVLADNAEQIATALENYLNGGPDTIELEHTRAIFWGQKICTNMLKNGTFRKRDYYGTWEENAGQQISFTPLPKRQEVLPDGRLLIRDLGGRDSVPYVRAMGDPDKPRSEDGALAEILSLAMSDMPDGGWFDEE
jgi:hypothetical protein